MHFISYVGEWRKGLQHGTGSYSFANSRSTYQGSFEQGSIGRTQRELWLTGIVASTTPQSEDVPMHESEAREGIAMAEISFHDASAPYRSKSLQKIPIFCNRPRALIAVLAIWHRTLQVLFPERPNHILPSSISAHFKWQRRKKVKSLKTVIPRGTLHAAVSFKKQLTASRLHLQIAVAL